MNYIRLTPATFRVRINQSGKVHVYSMSSRNVSIDGAHSHIYTQIFGIAASPVTGLLGTQTLSCGRLTAELLFQTHPPSRHNTPSSISSHLFPCSAPQWAFMDHFHYTKPTFVHRGPVLEESIYIFFFAKTFFDVRRFPLESTQFREAKQLFIRVGSQVLRWFVYYVIQPVSWGKIDGSKIF